MILEPESDVEDEATTADGSARVTRAPRISRENVYQAADALLLEGHRPTIDRVRMRLGRGSPNTIQEHLDSWWTKLGSRLKDIPGREIPGVPDDVATALVGLWNTALDSAQSTLSERAVIREAAMAERESAVQAREEEAGQQDTLVAARYAAQEESLVLAREQLVAANHRAERLEASLHARELELKRSQRRTEALETELRELRVQIAAAAAAQHIERKTLDERYAASEARWLVEVDRGRQALKESAKECERVAKGAAAQVRQLQAQSGKFKRDLQISRAEARATLKTNLQLQKRIDALTKAAPKVRSDSGKRDAAYRKAPNPNSTQKPAARRGRRQ